MSDLLIWGFSSIDLKENRMPPYAPPLPTKSIDFETTDEITISPCINYVVKFFCVVITFFNQRVLDFYLHKSNTAK